MTENQPPPRSASSGGRATLLYRAMRGCSRLVSTQLFDLKVYGRHHIPAAGGVLVVSNHQSYLDPMLIAVQLRRPMSFLAKSELFKNRYFGWLITSLNAFPVRQGAGDVGAIKETIRRLQEGHLLNIFPEGSRTEDGKLQPIAAGAALVIRKAGVPVVPAIIDGSYDAWPKDQKLPRRHPTRVMYGPVMRLDGLKAAEIVKKIDETFHTMMRELREKDVRRAEISLD